MLRRFQLIKAIGCFGQASAGSVQFERLTFIHGENCYGKSTLCDILRSFAEGTPDYLVDRLTVPATCNTAQQVDLTLLLPGQTREVQFRYREGVWNPQVPADLRFLVFDTDFMNRSVFTGLTIERRNQESITRFILGEASVSTAQRIAELRSEHRQTSQQLRELEGSAFRDIPDLPRFLSIEVYHSVEAIAEEQRRLGDRLSLVTRLASDIDRARLRPEPSPIICPSDMRALVTRVNQTLSASYTQAHSEAVDLVRRHLLQNLAGNAGSQAWLRQGIALRREAVCPFCGQPFGDNALHLLEGYQQFFDAAFERYMESVRATLDSLLTDFSRLSLQDPSAQVHQNAQVLTQYPELNDQPEWCELVVGLSGAAEKVTAVVECLRRLLPQIGVELRSYIQQKRESVHAPVGPWEQPEFLAVLDEVITTCIEYNELLLAVQTRILTFKEHLDPSILSAELDTLRAAIAGLQSQQQRLAIDEHCRRYIALRCRQEELDREIPVLQRQLETAQACFLDEYFAAINHLFSALGSSGFGISRRVNRRGNLPTVELIPTYCQCTIPASRLNSYFSESDRRALALSIFLAKVKAIPASERPSIVVVLDDPVTSFDDGRIDRTIRLLDELRSELRQLVVVSHYSRYIRAFCERASAADEGVSLARIVKTDTGSQLERAKLQDFTETSHERMFRQIRDFIARRHTVDISRDLRVYLERELRWRFYKQMIDGCLQNAPFADLMAALRGCGAITPALHSRIEALRHSLNPEHHCWTDRTQEDKISIAEDVLKCVYEDL